MGNIDAKRDWGHAKEYVKAMWLMLQQYVPDDYIIATGEAHSVKEFLEIAFSYVGLKWQDYVKVDHKFFRPSEINILKGDATKAKEKLGWENKCKFEDLVCDMVEADPRFLNSKKI